MKEKHVISKLVNKTRDHVNQETELDILKAASRVMPKTYKNPDAHHQDSFWRLLGPNPPGKTGGSDPGLACGDNSWTGKVGRWAPGRGGDIATTGLSRGVRTQGPRETLRVWAKCPSRAAGPDNRPAQWSH